MEPLKKGCMLSHAKLPKSFLGEAMRTSVDLINFSLSVPLEGDVRERVWRWKDVSYDHLRVFGCKAFVHVPKDERFKLDDKAKPCIFLGYCHEEFGYRLRNQVNKKIIRNKDVVFLEDQLFDDGDKVEKPESSVDTPMSSHTCPPPVVHDDHGGDEQ